MLIDSHQFRELISSFLPAGWTTQWLWPALTACLLSAGLTAFLIKIAPRRGWVAIPGNNRWNRRVVAQFGGVPILLAAGAVAVLLPAGRSVITLLLLTLAMALLGLVDDVIGLGPKPKLVVEFLLGCWAVHAGIVHPLTHTHLLNAAFTVFWIVAITNAFNLIDNIDGLAAGIAVIALTQVIVLAGLQAPAMTLALCLLASAVGFLFFNLHPAKVFMGDVGSLPIGFFLACASVMTASHLSSLGSVLLVPCLVLFIPIFDMLLVSITRRLKGRAISRGARDHASHRLVLLGLTEHQAVTILCGVAFVAGVLAFCWEKFWPAWGAGFLTLFLIAATLFWLYLAKLELPDSWLSESSVLIINIPAFFLRLTARFSALVLDTVIIILGFYFACLSNPERLNSVFLTQFWIAAGASVLMKLAFLMAAGTYSGRWTLTGTREIYPILKGIFASACFVGVAWFALAPSHAVPYPVILADAVFTSSLLLLARSSTHFFDYLLGKLRVRPAAKETLADQPQVYDAQAASRNDMSLPTDKIM